MTSQSCYQRSYRGCALPTVQLTPRQNHSVSSVITKSLLKARAGGLLFRRVHPAAFKPLTCVGITRTTRGLSRGGGRCWGGAAVHLAAVRKKAVVEISLRSVSILLLRTSLPRSFPPSPLLLCIFHFTCLNKKVDVNVLN